MKASTQYTQGVYRGEKTIKIKYRKSSKSKEEMPKLWSKKSLKQSSNKSGFKLQ